MSQFEREGKTMGIIDKSKLRGKAGFSLLELMVVIAIIGVLATVAIPRYDIFRARARQGEAKLNLGVIHKLQESFLIEHESYYDGVQATWGGQSMKGFANSVGYRGGATRGQGESTPGAGDAVAASTGRVCETNKLGFRLANCASARYAYYIADANETEFLAVAFGTSDAGVGDERIYPGCNGGTTSNEPSSSTGGSNVASTCSHTFSGDASHARGDAWCIDEQRNMENYRDIVEYCPE